VTLHNFEVPRPLSYTRDRINAFAVLTRMSRLTSNTLIVTYHRAVLKTALISTCHLLVV